MQSGCAVAFRRYWCRLMLELTIPMPCLSIGWLVEITTLAMLIMLSGLSILSLCSSREIVCWCGYVALMLCRRGWE